MAAAAHLDPLLRRLDGMNPAQAEANVIRTYLDWVLNIPWRATTDDNLDGGLDRDLIFGDNVLLNRVGAPVEANKNPLFRVLLGTQLYSTATANAATIA